MSSPITPPQRQERSNVAQLPNSQSIQGASMSVCAWRRHIPRNGRERAGNSAAGARWQELLGQSPDTASVNVIYEKLREHSLSPSDMRMVMFDVSWMEETWKRIEVPVNIWSSRNKPFHNSKGTISSIEPGSEFKSTSGPVGKKRLIVQILNINLREPVYITRHNPESKLHLGSFFLRCGEKKRSEPKTANPAAQAAQQYCKYPDGGRGQQKSDAFHLLVVESLLYAACRSARRTKTLLSTTKLLPALFVFIQESGRFTAAYGDFAKVELPDQNANNGR
ncbi:hypothetical protein K438DRAFT_1758529 [Mycena galopus ATCC 62051]|nr:hypothetical protein K438DRAFT_1758529 [Mycena galopus ATCC 62051]